MTEKNKIQKKKTFCQKMILGLKKILGPKIFLGLKKFWV